MATALGDVAAGIASELGWSVFPLRPSSKAPATRDGFHAATTDTDLIGRWWKRCPTMNVGIATGASRLLVIDLDVKTDDGLANWYALGAAHAGWTDTAVVSTPSGGEHWYFTLEPGWAIRNSAGRLAAGIDVRADGGYVVAPPSQTPSGPYDATNDHPAAPAPDWLIALLRQPPRPRVPLLPDRTRGGYGDAALDGELGRLAIAREGTRNDTLVRSAFRLGQLVAGGTLDERHVVAELLTVALRIGLAEHEAVATITSGLNAGMRQPRTVP